MLAVHMAKSVAINLVTKEEDVKLREMAVHPDTYVINDRTRRHDRTVIPVGEDFNAV